MRSFCAARVVLATTLALALSPGLALAGDNPDVDRGLATIERAARAHDTAEAALRAARNTQEELAHRITALKRLRAAGSGRLTELLARSVTVEQDLAARTAARDGARGELERQVASTVQLIDDQIRALRPGLKGPRAAEVARRLKGLLRDRERARSAIARLGAQERSAPQAWSQYEVKVEALDGPADLREKADFVEDTRDKLRKKREALERMVADARQAREIARASVNFRTEVGLFDEQSRTGRVSKSESNSGRASPTLAGGGAETQAANKDIATPSPEAPEPVAVADPGGQQRGNEDTNNFGSADALPPASLVVTPPVVTTTPLAPVAPVAPAASGGSPALPKSVDPSTLLNLDLRAVGAGRDVASMEAMLRDLAAIDAFLDARADQIRRRAQTLEADEAKVLGRP